MQKIPDLTEARAELNARLTDVQLNQQQLRLHILDFVKLLAKVVATLRSESQSVRPIKTKEGKRERKPESMGKKSDSRSQTWCKVKIYSMSCKESTTMERSCSDMREATELKNSCTATGAICSLSGMRGSHSSL